MEALWGRKVLINEFNYQLNTSLSYTCLPTMAEVNDKSIKCLRCGQVHLKQQVRLPMESFYCPECIQLGRVDSQSYFYHIEEPISTKRNVLFKWNGQLTEGQKKISQDLIYSIKKKESCLVWAVTGAGKTEMLFESIFYALKQGYRVAISSPRVDVCLELFPRIQEVFPNEEIALLHGKAKEMYKYTKLLVCTTHQLLRFYQAFDVLIVDELDAFPFVNNPILQYGVEQSLKKKHTCIYLTATPTKVLKEKVNSKKLAVSILPARYHRRILPVPKAVWCSDWQKKIGTGRCPKKISQKLEKLLLTNNVLIFCPSITLMKDLEKILKRNNPNLHLTCVYSEDPQRLDKVQNMRKNEYQVLITSTILERGVTFKNISVIVIGANHRLFTEASLVQIAGRVDRQLVSSKGQVYFIHDGYSLAMKAAIKQIESMNKMAKKRKMIDDL